MATLILAAASSAIFLEYSAMRSADTACDCAARSGVMISS